MNLSCTFDWGTSSLLTNLPPCSLFPHSKHPPRFRHLPAFLQINPPEYCFLLSPNYTQSHLFSLGPVMGLKSDLLNTRHLILLESFPLDTQHLLLALEALERSDFSTALFLGIWKAVVGNFQRCLWLPLSSIRLRWLKITQNPGFTGGRYKNNPRNNF